jgi:metal-responsive CopG/Arc/MetJ family transcriptional regulator
MSDEYDLIHMKFDKPLLDAVDDYRREQSQIPSRAEAIRQLMRRALNARGKYKSLAPS